MPPPSLAHALRSAAVRAQISRATGRRASVAAILCPGRHADAAGGSGADPDEKILFIKRASHAHDPWSGHVAFPGGRAHAGEDDEATAVRETLEEVGLNLADHACWQRLGRVCEDRTLYPRGRELTISLFGWVAREGVDATEMALTLQRKEVSAAWWVNVSALSPSQLEWQQMPVGEVIAPLRRRPRLAHALGLESINVASIVLPPPTPIQIESELGELEGAGGGLGHTCLWGLTLAFCSEMLARAGRRALVGESAAVRGFRRPYRSSNLVADACLALGLRARWWRAKVAPIPLESVLVALTGSACMMLSYVVLLR